MNRLILPRNAEANAVDEFADSVGWTEVALDPHSYDSEDYPARLWDAPGGQVRFVDDTVLEIQYVDLDTPSPDVEAAVRTAFQARDRDEILDLLDLTGAADRVCRMLHMLARATQATPFHQRTVDAATAALEHADEDVQIAALAVAGRSGWAHFLPHVAALAEHSDSPRVRAFAGNARTILKLRCP